ncbi:putative bifunctional diguanylate cyclase/phosphodiesterase [Pseudonocardia hydrocarbonoxydans]|uniref:GGDEF domain-containing protein n=1 Tax=Pseudonocardia hydrocarbonoxydans TaxID=76726 RepID=A0A4Y3WRK8_9PSEU|nr:GGDEF and EAL domain-containing protein [Pseudonocardia hydrocarbonoxydans]GEC21128.1 hypothetical protein PHY01_34110 [Pseudonocardia hydrocarbonoxydans]
MTTESDPPADPPSVAAACLAPVAMLVVDGGGVRWHNTAAARLVEPYGGRWSDPDGPAALVVAVDGGGVRLRWSAPDGSVRWWRAGSQELSGGRLVALSDETDYDGGPVAAVPDTATWDWDVATDRVRLSPGLADMLGVPHRPGCDWLRVAALVHRDDRRTLYRTLRDAVRTGGSWRHVVRMLPTDGSGIRTFEVYGEVRDTACGPSRRLVGTARDVTELRSARQALAFLCGNDTQTGVASRRRVISRLTECATGRQRAAVVVVDVDRLGDVNELHGMAAGDEVLRSVAAVLHRGSGGGATVGRIGGDRFAAVLPGRSVGEAIEVGRRLCAAVDRTPLRVGAGIVHVAISVGVAEVVRDDVDASLGNACLALAEAKRTGRNRAVPFTADLHRAAHRRATLLRRVDDALDHDTMGLNAQPIVDLRSGRVTRYELLIRLRDGQHPPVGPAEFLPLVEPTELVHRLDRWVVGRAVRALATPRARALDLRLEANLSGRSLEDPDFGPWVLAELSRHGVEPGRLGVELTETAAVTELAAARSLATLLIDSGVGFALDDFGAGFGSFSYLKHLRFTSVKIAGDFVEHIDREPVDRALVGAVVVVARQLGLVTVAERVDRPELVDELRLLGVDHGQGYHLGRPVPLDGLVGAAPDRSA